LLFGFNSFECDFQLNRFHRQKIRVIIPKFYHAFCDLEILYRKDIILMVAKMALALERMLSLYFNIL